MSLRILIADDHEIVRRGLRSLLSSRGEWNICGEAVDGREALNKAKELKPDVVVLDVSMPELNGLEAARLIREQVPESEILILSQHESREMVNEAIHAGARGYVVKSDISRDLLTAIEGVSQHQPQFSARLRGAGVTERQENREKPRRSAVVPVYDAEAILAGVKESVAVLDEDFRFAYINDNSGFYAPHSKQEVLGKNLWELFPELKDTQFEDELRRAMADRKFRQIEIFHARSGLWLEHRIQPSNGGLALFTGDVTPRKRAEEALERARGQLEQLVRERTAELERKTAQISEQAKLLDMANDAIFIRNMEGAVFYWNEGARRLYGWTKEEVAFQSLGTFLQTEFPVPFEEILEILLREGRWEGELAHRRKNGSRIVVASRWTLWKNPEGAPVGWLQINTDITERRRIEDGLRAMSARLLHLQDEERRRIARELHDSAGQLLVGLKLTLDAAQREAGRLPDRAQSSLDESMKLIDELSRELRTISHLLHPPLLDEAGLSSALRWYVEGFAERSGITVELEVSPDLGRLPRELETAIFRIVQECLTNIHRHSGSSTAGIHIDRDEQQLTLQVRDFGKGMTLETAQGSPRPARPGVGILGMRERVRQLGGKLELSSTARGTTIMATLPLSYAKAQTAGATENSC